MKTALTAFFLFLCCLSPYSQTADWREVLKDRIFEKTGQTVTDKNFFEFDESYHYFTDYPLTLIHPDGSFDEIMFQYEGFAKLLDKKQPILDANFQRIEKADIEYLLFDTFLFKNMDVGEMITEDFALVCVEGPISVYREYYTAPITKENIASGFRVFEDRKEFTGFYLGKFKNKVANLIKDNEGLSLKVKNEEPGYTESDENFFKIVEEYNEWVQTNDKDRYELNDSFASVN